MKIADAAERAAALDPTRSFCVSAPAGSGKTELLIQRYLVLLSRVQRPEQVVAITFTRKAATEMRQRVMQALHAAAADVPVQGAHQQVTRLAAARALAADAAGEWQLTRDENRLNIKTIDGFCMALTRQMPVLSRFGGPAEIVDEAAPLYQEAIAGLFEVLQSGEPPANELKALLAHFDNHWPKVQGLLLDLLQRRDQWGEYVGVRHHPRQAEALLTETVHHLVAAELESLQRTLTPWSEQLLGLLRYTADQLGHPQVTAFPSAEPTALPAWRGLKRLLLTGQNNWRKSVNKRDGFPAGDAEAKAHKVELMSILAHLKETPGLLDQLIALDKLPETEADNGGWQIVLSLAQLLPRLNAELLLVFARRGQVDHSQVALSALDALGDDESPTELALRLDYRIEHILVDEFQDTAINQFELVRRLSRGWGSHNAVNPEAPRTLMIVGDAMQSIYGFRDANVGLFLKARDEGFNGVVLEPLQLCVNFRSDEGVVNWVNRTFKQAFPQRDNTVLGEVSFTPAVAVKTVGAASPVEVHGFQGDCADTQEIEFICEQVQRGMASEHCASIAVLGRSRAQLQPLLAAFRSRDITASAQGMETLADVPEVIDLLSLCRALLNPADRVAWLALLRAPWCGLTLVDLYRLVAVPLPLPAAIDNPTSASGLSLDGANRLAVVREALAFAQRNRDRLGLRVWLEQVWLRLGGPAALTSAGASEDVERFFQLVELADLQEGGLGIAWLNAKLDKLKLDRHYPHSKLEVMTLHKAKGLEFDWVFIPGLNRMTRSDSRPLLLWDDYTSPDGARGFLLSADDHSPDSEPTLYNYLRRQRKLKTRLETARLLYVGATRAVKRLFLTAQVQPDKGEHPWRKPHADALLSPVWKTAQTQLQTHPPDDSGHDAPAAGETAGGGLVRPALPTRSDDTQASSIRAQAGSASAKQTVRPDARAGLHPRLHRHVGTVVHGTLEALSRFETLPQRSPDATQKGWSIALRQLGLAGKSLKLALELVQDAVGTTLSSKDGRWMLSSEHAEAHSEWSLSIADPAGGPRELVIDRCFVTRDRGERWIIDYKTDRPAPGQAKARFVTDALIAHRTQLQTYRDALAALSTEPLRCAIYLTASGELVELGELYLPGR